MCTKITEFRNDVEGGITAFTVSIFLIMFVSLGMAVDFMRHETMRAELQDALDRGILAAASFSQTMDDEEEIVRAYMKTTNFVKEGYKLSVPEPILNGGSRRIEATASYKLDTYFLRLVGIPTLDVVATGAAIEGASIVEISLALDISTSMALEQSNGTERTRLDVLQSSASQFVELLYRDTHRDRLTMSLIPFAGQVNIGPKAMAYLGATSVHNYSHCVEMTAADLYYDEKPENETGYDYAYPWTTITQMPINTPVQMQQFNYSIYISASTGQKTYAPDDSIGDIDFGWCPSDTQQVEYFSRDMEELKTRIENLKTHEATGTHYGMKWAAALLDPTANDLAIHMTDDASTEVPHAYNDGKVQKYIVLMSDGNTTGGSRLNSQYYQTQADREFYAANLSTNQSRDFYNYSVNGGFLTYEQSRQENRDFLLAACKAAKENGVIIFTIGFDIEADSFAYSDLSSCASTLGHFYDVDGLELADAFSDIAAQIQKLKLLN